MMVLGVSMFPQVAVLSGLFEVIRALGLYNTSWALILSYTIFTLPFTVWVLTTFMGQLPHELEEAAIMDGASPWVTLTRVLLPLLWPALVTTGLLAFIAAWNEFLFALTFTLTDAQRTVPVAIALISGGSSHELPWASVDGGVGAGDRSAGDSGADLPAPHRFRPDCRRVKGLMHNHDKEQHHDEIEASQHQQAIGRHAYSARRQPGDRCG